MTTNYTTSTLNVAGLKVSVYKTSTLGDDMARLPVAVLFLMHGRGDQHDVHYILEIVERTFEYYNVQRKLETPSHELVIVTFDHRNAGHRTVDEYKNRSWGPKDSPRGGNDTNGMDIYGHFTGTARDVSFLIDFLPPYLYPNDEQTIDVWAAAGVSLGALSTWVTLANDPRITIGIPIIGTPNILASLRAHAVVTNTPFAPPFVPNSLLALIERLDPAQQPNTLDAPANPFVGKKILELSGADDWAFPPSMGAAWMDRLELGPGGVKKVFVQQGVGHECTPEMRDMAAEFLWTYALGPVKA